jgi:hypothetical protein
MQAQYDIAAGRITLTGFLPNNTTIRTKRTVMKMNNIVPKQVF